MRAAHAYELSLRWTGNRGHGTTGYREYDRDHVVLAAGKPDLAGSADRSFRGNGARWNPEELLVASLAQCHMLWYLHLASEAGVVAMAYTDTATGLMLVDTDGRGGGQFSEVVLHPHVVVADVAMADAALTIHHDVGALCFIARSMNFPVLHKPTVEVTTAESGRP